MAQHDDTAPRETRAQFYERTFRQRQIALTLGLDANGRWLLMLLIDESDRTGAIRLSDQVLMDRSAFSESTLGRAKKTLLARGAQILILVKRGHYIRETGVSQPTRYRLGFALTKACQLKHDPSS